MSRISRRLDNGAPVAVMGDYRVDAHHRVYQRVHVVALDTFIEMEA